MSIEDFNVLVATEEHTPFAQAICDEMAESAKARGTGIANWNSFRSMREVSKLPANPDVRSSRWR